MIKYITSDELLTSRLYSRYLDLCDDKHLLYSCRADEYEVRANIEFKRYITIVYTRTKHKGYIIKFEVNIQNHYDNKTKQYIFKVKE